jgi:hypothetical protein
MKPSPFWVVIKLDEDGAPYVESTYEAGKYAQIRVKHLLANDKASAWAQEVVPPYTWLPLENPTKFRFKETRGRGQELLNYHEHSTDQDSLGAALTRAWTSWREAQAARGNLEEAAQEPPPIPPELFEEPGAHLRLFPRDLP